MFNETQRKYYKKGETVKFHCKEKYSMTPENGEVVCGATDWDRKPKCAPSELLNVEFL